MRFTKKDMLKTCEAMFIGVWVVAIQALIKLLEYGLELLKRDRLAILVLESLVPAIIMLFIGKKMLDLTRKQKPPF